MPLVSVIIPNYNHERFLEKRLNSVLNQTFNDFEIVVLDDCSTDNSRQIIDRYRSHPKIKKVIYNEVNSGSAFKQWQKGIEWAQGDYIWIAESDDWCEPVFLESIMKIFILNSSVVLGYCQSKEINEGTSINDNMLWWTEDLDKKWEHDYTGNGINEIKKFLIWKNTIPNASAVIFARHAYNKAGREFINMKYCGDWLLWIQLLLHGNIGFCAQPLNYFRSHSLTTRILDTPSKVRLRGEEEYTILQFLERNVHGADKNDVSLRRQQIALAFSNSFTKKDFLRIMFNPFLYKSPIPFSLNFISYIKTKLNKMIAG